SAYIIVCNGLQLEVHCINTRRSYYLMGWRSEYIDTMGEWGPAALVFDNVRVPEENILGEVHGGYNLGLEWIGFARWIVGARAVGDRKSTRMYSSHVSISYEVFRLNYK